MAGGTRHSSGVSPRHTSPMWRSSAANSLAVSPRKPVTPGATSQMSPRDLRTRSTSLCRHIGASHVFERAEDFGDASHRAEAVHPDCRVGNAPAGGVLRPGDELENANG